MILSCQLLIKSHTRFLNSFFALQIVFFDLYKFLNEMDRRKTLPHPMKNNRRKLTARCIFSLHLCRFCDVCLVSIFCQMSVNFCVNFISYLHKNFCIIFLSQLRHIGVVFTSAVQRRICVAFESNFQILFKLYNLLILLIY